MNRHTWRLSSHFSDVPRAYDKGPDPVPSALVDYSCYVSLEHTALKHSGLGEVSIMGSALKGEVYDSYPRRDQSEAPDAGDIVQKTNPKQQANRGRTVTFGHEDFEVSSFPMNIPSFAFPHGVRVAWTSSRQRDRCHSFTLTQGAGNTVYGHCYTLQHTARDRLLALVRLQEFLPIMTSKQGQGEEWLNKMRKLQLFEPGVICLLTSRPLHSLIKQTLETFVTQTLMIDAETQLHRIPTNTDLRNLHALCTAACRNFLAQIATNMSICGRWDEAAASKTAIAEALVEWPVTQPGNHTAAAVDENVQFCGELSVESAPSSPRSRSRSRSKSSAGSAPGSPRSGGNRSRTISATVRSAAQRAQHRRAVMQVTTSQPTNIGELSVNLKSLNDIDAQHDVARQLRSPLTMPEAVQEKGMFSVPSVNIDYNVLCERLKPELIIAIVESLMLEHAVVLVSSSTNPLMDVSEALLSLLYPFQWNHIYIPLMPMSLNIFNVLLAPLPLFVGVCTVTSSALADFLRSECDPNNPILAVDIDEGCVIYGGSVHVVHTMVRDDECNEKQQPGSELLHAYIPRVSVLGEPGLPLPVWLKLYKRLARTISGVWPPHGTAIAHPERSVTGEVAWLHGRIVHDTAIELASSSDESDDAAEADFGLNRGTQSHARDNQRSLNSQRGRKAESASQRSWLSSVLDVVGVDEDQCLLPESINFAVAQDIAVKLFEEVMRPEMVSSDARNTRMPSRHTSSRTDGIVDGYTMSARLRGRFRAIINRTRLNPLSEKVDHRRDRWDGPRAVVRYVFPRLLHSAIQQFQGAADSSKKSQKSAFTRNDPPSKEELETIIARLSLSVLQSLLGHGLLVALSSHLSSTASTRSPATLRRNSESRNVFKELEHYTFSVSKLHEDTILRRMRRRWRASHQGIDDVYDVRIAFIATMLSLFQTLPLYIRPPTALRQSRQLETQTPSRTSPRAMRRRQASKSVHVTDVFNEQEFVNNEFALNPARKAAVPFVESVLATLAFSCFLHACVRCTRAQPITTTQWQQTEFARLSVAKPFLKWSMNRLRSKYSKYEKWSSACLEEELHVSFETQDANSTGGHRRTLAARMAYTLRKIHNGLKMSPKTSHDQKWPLGKDPKKWGFCKVVITGEAMSIYPITFSESNPTAKKTASKLTRSGLFETATSDSIYRRVAQMQARRTGMGSATADNLGRVMSNSRQRQKVVARNPSITIELPPGCTHVTLFNETDNEDVLRSPDVRSPRADGVTSEAAHDMTLKDAAEAASAASAAARHANTFKRSHKEGPDVRWAFKVSTPTAKIWLCAASRAGRRRWVSLIKSRATRVSYLNSLKGLVLEQCPELEQALEDAPKPAAVDTCYGPLPEILSPMREKKSGGFAQARKYRHSK